MTMTDAPFHRLGWSNPVGDPATGRVYGMGTQCMLTCMDGTSGAVVWQRQMTEEFGLISTFGGRTSSPAIDEDQVFIAGVSFGWGNHAGGQHRIFALNKNTGELNWSAGTGGIPVDAPYNTPVIAVINGEKLVIFAAGDGGIHAFQARTGKKVWSFKGSKHGMNSSVVVHGDHVFASWDPRIILTAPSSAGWFAWTARLSSTARPKKSGVRMASKRAFLRRQSLMARCMSRPTMRWFMRWMNKPEAIKYKHGFGTIGKASLVYGDGKLYYPEANGRMWILRPRAKNSTVLSHVDLEDKPGREYVIFGSVAVSNGQDVSSGRQQDVLHR